MFCVTLVETVFESCSMDCKGNAEESNYEQLKAGRKRGTMASKGRPSS